MSGASTPTKAERFAMAMLSARREFDLVSADCDYFITRTKKLEAENAKLRKLVRDIYVQFDSTIDWTDIERRMRELGIEVEG